MSAASQKPLKKDIVQRAIIRMIADQNLQAGDRLQSEKKLAAELRVNHQTLRAAFAELAAMGILERRPGSGTFVAHTAVGRNTGDFAFAGDKTVIVVMRDDPHFFSDLKNDIVSALEANGLLPITLSNREQLSRENIQQLLKLNALGARQLVIDQNFIGSSKEAGRLLQQPGVEFDNVVIVPGNQTTDSVLPGHMVQGDYADAYNRAIAHLKQLGHQRIGFCVGSVTTGSANWLANRRYAELYSQAMLKNGLANGIKIYANSDTEAMRAAFREFIGAGCSAIFADCDYRAVIALEEARKLKLLVPEDFSVIGFFDTPWAEHYNMTTFRYRNAEMAAAVVKCLNDHHNAPQLSLVKLDFIERGTTANNTGARIKN